MPAWAARSGDAAKATVELLLSYAAILTDLARQVTAALDELVDGLLKKPST